MNAVMECFNIKIEIDLKAVRMTNIDFNSKIKVRKIKQNIFIVKKRK